MAAKDVLKVMKNPRDPLGTVIPADWGIEYFLEDHGSATPTEIKRHLAKHGASYSLPAITKILKKMKSKKIVTVDESRRSPVYSIGNETIAGDIVEHMGFLFSSYASDAVLKTRLPISNSKPLENTLDEIVVKAGVYSAYSKLLGWELAMSIGKTDNERLEIQRKWLKNMGEIQSLSTHFDSLLETLFDVNGIGLGSKFSSHDKKLLKIKKLQKVLQQKYPEIMKSLRKSFATLPKVHSKHEEIVKQRNELKAFEEYKKRLEAKRKGDQPGKIVPRNTCPRCHFNGKRKITTGPFKGIKFSVRSLPRHKTGNQEYWLCPQCEFNVPISKI